MTIVKFLIRHAVRKNMRGQVFLFQVGEVEHTAVTSEDGEEGTEWTRELRCGNENVF